MLKRASRSPIHDGDDKLLFEGPAPGTLIQHFKDEVTHEGKQVPIPGKGVLNNRISEFLMTKLADIGVPNHFIKKLNMREHLVKSLEVLPVRVIVRNIATGTFVKRLGVKEGSPLPRAIVEFYYKIPDGDYTLVNEEHIAAFGWATPAEIDEILSISMRTNDFLMGLFLGVGISLVDFRLEFGRLSFSTWDETRLAITDEISPDSCRLWDLASGEKFGKDRVRANLSNFEYGYKEIAERLGLLPSMPMEKIIGDLFSGDEAGRD
ncbi:MAG: phosphoribosylaminoimidazolesuccinocarboxamide synthase [Alphaproteobacteria bacterium]|jgi:phosphoribosylaminoimidazole-succinocarboxamide synthase|nr:phosphoribosylaminoimidazolesuccinocarboxamide synthase [Alphaproteobacteria bacterium]MBT5389391.1 phosphoribosylaminoimidazolesuccinocarboxamide synthase [Alphaproteobacteria bacterium]MBT5655146.1 phosphoribosylaminoimidazolesuccinocarboxamide synthase [Alphaproteobacteria bacterium]